MAEGKVSGTEVREDGGSVLQGRALVIGDYLVDRYWIGTSNRLSAEAPIPIVKIEEIRDLEGGAGNVVENIQSLGGRAYIPGASSRDIKKPIKNRLFVDNVQVARWDQNDECEPTEFTGVLPGEVKCVVVADYAKGAVTSRVIEALSYTTLPIFIDTKDNPRKFASLYNPYFFPNQKEYDEYPAYQDLENVILKRGAHGLMYLRYGAPILNVPALAQYVTCVNGAGDTVVAAVVTKFLEIGKVCPECVIPFAARAAAVVVQKPYTSVATKEEVNGIK
jgi:bifunctional ADP-heptose synthase (sugar kinase/adenylyltransferase)